MINENVPAQENKNHLVYLFLKKMYQYPYPKRCFVANTIQKEGEHGFSTIQIALMRIFYPNEKLAFSWSYAHQLGITKHDIQLYRKMQKAGLYANIYLDLPAQKQQMILEKLKTPLLKDKIYNQFSSIIRFLKTREN